MRKSDKKVENLIRDVLTDVCEETLKGYEGFLWVTHTVKFFVSTKFRDHLCI